MIQVNNEERLMQTILDVVCALTNTESGILMSKNRKWSLMYARYLFFHTAMKLNINAITAVKYVGRNRTMAYPYQRAVKDLHDCDAQFRSDCNKVYEQALDHL